MVLYIKLKSDYMVRINLRKLILINTMFLSGSVALKELNFVSPTPSQFQAFRNEVIALKFVLS